MILTAREKVFNHVIKELVKEKNKLETKLSLKGTGWMLLEDHPRYGYCKQLKKETK